MVFLAFFHLSLNFAIRSSWSEPKSAPGLFIYFFFGDRIELFPSLAENNIINLIWRESAWRTMDRGSWHCTGDTGQDHPQEKKHKNEKWLSGEALQIAEKRREVKGEMEIYTHFSAEFQRIARRDKKAFLSDQCKEVEEISRIIKTSSVQSLSRVQLWHHELQHASLPVHHQLPESTQTHVCPVGDAIRPHHPLSPLLLLPSILPSIRVFSNESALHIRWTKYWSFSFNISPSNKHPRTDLL